MKLLKYENGEIRTEKFIYMNEEEQVDHGFSVSDLIRYDTTTSTYVKSQADSADNADVYGVVVYVNGNIFRHVSLSGITLDVFSGLTKGTVYYLDATTPGTFTSTAPSQLGEVYKPVLYALSSTTAVFINYPGIEIISAEQMESLDLLKVDSLEENTLNNGIVLKSKLLPEITNTIDLGSDTLRFKDGYFSGDVLANNLVYTTGDQTIAGEKTFTSAIYGNVGSGGILLNLNGDLSNRMYLYSSTNEISLSLVNSSGNIAQIINSNLTGDMFLRNAGSGNGHLFINSSGDVGIGKSPVGNFDITKQGSDGSMEFFIDQSGTRNIVQNYNRVSTSYLQKLERASEYLWQINGNNTKMKLTTNGDLDVSGGFKFLAGNNGLGLTNGSITLGTSGTNRTDPIIIGRAGSDGASDSNFVGLGFKSVNRNDETGFEGAGFSFQVARSSNAPITSGVAVLFRNWGTTLMSIDYLGNTSVGGLFFLSEYSNGNSGTSKTINWNNGNMQTITMTGNCSFTFTAPTSGVGRLDLKVVQDATGGRNLTFPSTVKWPDGAPSWTSMTGNQRCIVTFRYDGTHYVAVATGNYS